MCDGPVMCLIIILSILSRKKNQGELKKISLSPKEVEDGEDEMSEAKDNGSRDEVLVPHKNCRKNTTVPGRKGEEKSLAPVFAEKLISPSRRGAKLKDCESHQENEDRNSELDQDEEDKESFFRGFLNLSKKHLINKIRKWLIRKIPLEPKSRN
ncbi:putative uncharacterized protein encoded by LINC00471 isoform X1 [Pongo pygmaeus]|uniref:putative uncharacterized protein encoded by LINC00471 isoform X1 n=1 Tax=Pongo pygmaeus TaxID=9600 RepID=UPI00300CD8D6